MRAARPTAQIALLEGSRDYFPALMAAIDAARSEIHIETYIFDFHGSALEVAQALERAARRGVQTCVLVDGVGTPNIPALWQNRLAQAGVQWQTFEPVAPLGLLVPSRWRRLHRKLCVVDGQVAFCGGINLLDDLYDPNQETALSSPRLDFAVRIQGPLVADVQHTMRQLWWRSQAARDWRDSKWSLTLGAWKKPSGDHHPMTKGRARLVLRDNLRQRNHIERHYLHALGRARSEVWMANAYFYPGARMRRALLAAAQRGVRITILVQGHYDHVLPYRAARHLYGPLLDAGVRILEYQISYMHAKVAVVDGQWVTIGSSNLDPLSLLLACEANVVARDALLSQALKSRLVQALDQGAREIKADAHAQRGWAERAMDTLAAGLLRLAIFVSGKSY
ncbi:MAG: cardiolipin synthase ClsB [Betaproteobacteria bacterium]|nr:cardiolipin synthase ClsB [Betaproteobacteria bacterium]NBY04972.1 cardiolipin synthase ClsB [Betaproteobacteria bacterium]